MTTNFPQNTILEDNTVLLRPLQESDVENLLEISINEPDTWNFSLIRANGKENLIKYIQLALNAKENGTEFPFIVFDKKSGKYAGSTRFYDIQLAFKTLQLGYTWSGKDFRGTGVNKHCKFLLLQFAFETLGMERVEFRADNNNQRSIAAMKSIGCKVEGVLRNHMPTLGSEERRDSIILSILRSEWFEEVKDNLGRKLQDELRIENYELRRELAHNFQFVIFNSQLKSMGTFVISKRFDDHYKFVFTSRKGKTIFTSTSFELKMDCEALIEEIKSNVNHYTYVKARAANGKYFFKIMKEELHVATSRKYTTPLLLQKGIDEIVVAAAKSDVLDFSIDEFVFPD